MNENEQNKSGPETLFADWMKTSTAFWESMASMWPAFNTAGGVTPDSKRDDKTSRFQKSWESTQKTWKAWSQIITEPETMKTLFKETGMLPEIFLKVAKECSEDDGVKVLDGLEQECFQFVEDIKNGKA